MCIPARPFLMSFLSLSISPSLSLSRCYALSRDDLRLVFAGNNMNVLERLKAEALLGKDRWEQMLSPKRGAETIRNLEEELTVPDSVGGKMTSKLTLLRNKMANSDATEEQQKIPKPPPEKRLRRASLNLDTTTGSLTVIGGIQPESKRKTALMDGREGKMYWLSFLLLLQILTPPSVLRRTCRLKFETKDSSPRGPCLWVSIFN